MLTEVIEANRFETVRLLDLRKACKFYCLHVTVDAYRGGVV